MEVTGQAVITQKFQFLALTQTVHLSPPNGDEAILI